MLSRIAGLLFLGLGVSGTFGNTLLGLLLNWDIEYGVCRPISFPKTRMERWHQYHSPTANGDARGQ